MIGILYCSFYSMDLYFSSYVYAVCNKGSKNVSTKLSRNVGMVDCYSAKLQTLIRSYLHRSKRGKL